MTSIWQLKRSTISSPLQDCLQQGIHWGASYCASTLQKLPMAPGKQQVARIALLLCCASHVHLVADHMGLARISHGSGSHRSSDGPFLCWSASLFTVAHDSYLQSCVTAQSYALNFCVFLGLQEVAFQVPSWSATPSACIPPKYGPANPGA